MSIQPLSCLENLQRDASTWKATSEEVSPNIFLRPDEAEFMQEVRRLFEEIKSNPVGFRLLAKIQKCTAPIFIISGKTLNFSGHHAEKYTGPELPPLVYVQVSVSLTSSYCYSPKAESIAITIDVALFHELVHAYHLNRGSYTESTICDPIVWTNDEEYRTIIGFPSKKGKTTAKITENAYRAAKGLPLRYGHPSPGKIDCLTILEISRIKLLGARYVKWMEANPNNFGPPPLQVCTREDVGMKCGTIIRLVVKIDELEKKRFSFRLPPMNTEGPLSGATSRFSLDSDNIKQAARLLAESLKEREFTVLRFDWTLISEQEFDLMEKEKEKLSKS